MSVNVPKKQYEVKYKKIQLKDLQFDQGDNVGTQRLIHLEFPSFV